MRDFVIFFVVLFALTANSQNFAVLTHAAAKTKQFTDGCPGGWPYSVKQLEDSKKLPPDLETNGWVVMTKAELTSHKELLEPAKEAWNQAIETAKKAEEEQAKISEKVRQDEIVGEVETGLKEWETVPEKEKGDVLLKLLHVILESLKSLGSDVKQIEKPASDIKSK